MPEAKQILKNWNKVKLKIIINKMIKVLKIITPYKKILKNKTKSNNNNNM